MFTSAFGIFSCQNGYHCVQNFVLTVLSAVTLFFYLKAYKVISSDRAQILEKMDKIIFYLAFVYVALLTFMHLVYVAPFLAFTLRALYLFMDVVMCTVVACIYFDQSKHVQIQKLMTGAFGWAVLLWFFSVMGRREGDVNAENECRYFGIVLFSLTAFVISGILAFCGYSYIKEIRINEMGENNYTSSGEIKSQVKKFEELNEQINKLIILIVVNLGAAFVQLAWDLKKYNENSSFKRCSAESNANNFIYMIAYTIMEGISSLLPTWGIFYLYYWKNRSTFRSQTDNWDRHLSDFDEIRSELIEMS